MNKKYIYGGLGLIAIALVVAFFMTRKDKSVIYYAQKFCTCATELSELETQRTMGRVSPAHYETAKKDFEKCLGTDKITFELASDSIKFYDALVREIRDQCPQVGRNMGFKIN